MLNKSMSFVIPLSVTVGWLASVGVLTSIFTDIEKQHRKEDKELIKKLQDEISALKDRKQ